MAATPSSAEGSGSVSRVTLEFPEGRELVWGSESVMATWQIGDVVVIRHDTWRVLGRTHELETESVTLTLGPAD
jgi:hypothetical protein